MNAAYLIVLGMRAAVAFAVRQHLSDRCPKASQTICYREAGITVSIATAGDIAHFTWDIDVTLADGRGAAIWQSVIETQATYSDDIAALWPLVACAINAAARGDLLLEVSATQSLPLAS